MKTSQSQQSQQYTNFSTHLSDLEISLQIKEMSETSQNSKTHFKILKAVIKKIKKADITLFTSMNIANINKSMITITEDIMSKEALEVLTTMFPVHHGKFSFKESFIPSFMEGYQISVVRPYTRIDNTSKKLTELSKSKCLLRLVRILNEFENIDSEASIYSYKLQRYFQGSRGLDTLLKGLIECTDKSYLSTGTNRNISGYSRKYKLTERGRFLYTLTRLSIVDLLELLPVKKPSKTCIPMLKASAIALELTTDIAKIPFIGKSANSEVLYIDNSIKSTKFNREYTFFSGSPKTLKAYFALKEATDITKHSLICLRQNYFRDFKVGNNPVNKLDNRPNYVEIISTPTVDKYISDYWYHVQLLCSKGNHGSLLQSSLKKAIQAATMGTSKLSFIKMLKVGANRTTRYWLEDEFEGSDLEKLYDEIHEMFRRLAEKLKSSRGNAIYKIINAKVDKRGMKHRVAYFYSYQESIFRQIASKLVKNKYGFEPVTCHDAIWLPSNDKYELSSKDKNAISEVYKIITGTVLYLK